MQLLYQWHSGSCLQSQWSLSTSYLCLYRTLSKVLHMMFYVKSHWKVFRLFWMYQLGTMSYGLFLLCIMILSVYSRSVAVFESTDFPHSARPAASPAFPVIACGFCGCKRTSDCTSALTRMCTQKSNNNTLHSRAVASSCWTLSLWIIFSRLMETDDVLIRPPLSVSIVQIGLKLRCMLVLCSLVLERLNK